MTATEQARAEDIIQRATCEQKAHKDWVLPLHIDLTSLMSLVGQLQLALRHPGNQGSTAKAAQTMVAMIAQQLREGGLIACAELVEMGNNPEYDA